MNSSLKNPRKLNTFETNDSYEVLDKRSKVDKNWKLRSRKLSSASEDHVALIDQSVKSVSRSKTIPTVNEPVEEDQLVAIRE